MFFFLALLPTVCAISMVTKKGTRRGSRKPTPKKPTPRKSKTDFKVRSMKQKPPVYVQTTVTSVENVIQLAIVDHNGNEHYSGHFNKDVREGKFIDRGFYLADVPMRVNYENDAPLKNNRGFNTKCYPVVMTRRTHPKLAGNFVLL